MTSLSRPHIEMYDDSYETCCGKTQHISHVQLRVAELLDGAL